MNNIAISVKELTKCFGSFTAVDLTLIHISDPTTLRRKSYALI